MSDTEHDNLLYQVASLYYESDQTQEQIGRKLHLTRWKVGRLLVEARQAGIVKIEVVHPQARLGSLERRLLAAYGLRDAVVLATQPHHDDEELRSLVAGAAAEHLTALHPVPRLLGVSWGRTLDLLARRINPGWTDGVTVVQINGGLTRSRHPSSAHDMASRLAHHGGGTVTFLPVPAIVEREDTRRLLEEDGSVSDVLAMATRADVFLYSPGGMGDDSVLVGSGHITTGDVVRLREAGAVGDVVGRFIDAGGRIIDPELDARTLGLPLDALRGAATSIAVVSGAAKHPVCRAVVTGGMCTTLITDDRTAEHLLHAEERRPS